MKINPGWRPFGKEVKSPEPGAAQQVQPKNFSDMLQQQDERASREQLQQMMEQIHRQADRLVKSMTIRELRQYKQLVRNFLEKTVRRGVGMKDTRGWDRRGRTKRYKLLDEIDRSLLDMADELLEQEEGRIQILRKVGEIRGLLINFTF